MDLYYSPLSAYSHKAMLAFYEKGISVDLQEVNLASRQSREQFRQVYPLGKVPCLKVPEGLISESSNIVEWLDLHYQTQKLIPSNAEHARQVRVLDRKIDLYIIANTSLLFFQSLKPDSEQDQERIAIAKRQLECVSNDLEALLQKQGNGWLVGGQLSLADLSLAVGLSNALHILPTEEYPALRDYLSQWQERPSYQQARQGFEPALQQMVEAMTAAA